MQLKQSISNAEIETLSEFIHPVDKTKLKTFEGVIIRLDDVILGGGWKKGDREIFAGRDYLPNLAVCGWRDPTCTVDITRGLLSFQSGISRFEVKGPLPVKDNTFTYRTEAPPVPNHIRALAGRSPKEPALLFEVGKWERMQNEPRPALEDPALITHLVGNLWGVLATWDLTKAEKAALEKFLK